MVVFAVVKKVRAHSAEIAFSRSHQQYSSFVFLITLRYNAIEIFISEHVKKVQAKMQNTQERSVADLDIDS